MNDNYDIFDDVIKDDESVEGSSDLFPVSLELEQENNPSQSVNDDPDLAISGIVNDQSHYDDDDEDEDDDQIAPTYTQQTPKSDLISRVLESKGIQGNTIQYENEDGEVEDVDFYTLPEAEQLAILNSSDADNNYGLLEDEINAINYLRENGASFEDVIDYHKRQAVQEYIDSQNIAGIEVEQYTDEQLFALDLKAKYDELTDDEIEIEIQKQLEHPDLFKKKVDKLRSDYKEIELDQLQQARLEEESNIEQRYTELQDNLVNVAQSVEDIGGLELDYEDKNDVLSFLLDKDINGNSPFVKSLEDPNTLFELAWYATKGKEAFGILHDYYKKQIESVRKDSYNKGKADSKPKEEAKATSKNFIRRETPTTGTGTKVPHINDLIID